MTIEKKIGGRPSKRPTDIELAFLYKTMTAREIAMELGVSEYTVRNWIAKSRKGEKK